MKYYIKLPNVLVDDNGFDDYADADAAARMITKNTSIKFVSIYTNKLLLTVIIKPKYNLYGFKQFVQFDKAKKISDYFILQQNGITNYYIKLKN